MKKRTISMLLALFLCISIVPLQSFAVAYDETASAVQSDILMDIHSSDNNGRSENLEEWSGKESYFTEVLHEGAEIGNLVSIDENDIDLNQSPSVSPATTQFDVFDDKQIYYPNASFVDNSVEPPNYTSGVTSTDDLANRLNALINKYQNTYWTQSGNPCSSHSGTCYSRYYYAWQCKGFAGYIFNDLFCGGNIGPYSNSYYYIPSPNNATLVGQASGYSSSDTATVKNILVQAQPGDFIQTRRRNKNYGHSMIVVSVNDSGVYLFDCNSDGKCGVKYYHQTWATFASKNSGMSLYHSTRYPGVSGCNCDTSYAGYYTCTTSSSNLTIRSGHGSSFAQVGKIPPGATVYVSKANGSWAHVEYNGITGFASMEYLSPQRPSSPEVDAKMSYWISYEQMGESIDSGKVGDWIYLCYRLFDANSGKNLNEAVPGRTFTVKETIYKPNGSIAHSYTYDDADNNWIGAGCYTAGTYTYEIVVEGEWQGTITGSFEVAPNPMEIHASSNSVDLIIGETEREDIYVWTTGYYADATVLSWSRSNSNISCSWGEWEDDLLPLTISANNAGTATVTLAVKDKATNTVLDTYIVDVSVTSKSYTVSYNANGGSGAPSNQTKTHGTALTLSSTIPVRFGYTFLGWSANSSSTSPSYEPGASFTTDDNVTLYAVWKAANAISSSVTNSTYSAPVTFANGCVYYVFEPAFSGKIQIESSGSNDPQVYLYSADGNQLAFDDDSGDSNNFLLTCSVATGTKYYLKVKYYKSGTGSINFTVKRMYGISYNANGGSGEPSAQTKVHGTALTLSSKVPTRSGYTFRGWSTSINAPGSLYSTIYQPGASFTVNADTILYAIWEKNCDNGHDYRSSSVILPTCTEDGYIAYTCMTCGDSYTEVIPGGHDYGNNGVCIRCGDARLKITQQPVSVTVGEGKTVKVTVTASGDGLTYKWYYKDAGSSQFYLTTSFTGNTYQIAMNAARNGRQIYCVISDKYGNSVQTDTVTLKMATLTITKQPANVTVAKGKTASVYVNVAGSGLTFKWYYKNTGDSKFYLTTSFKSNTYSVAMDASRNGRQVYCVISDKYGNSVQTNTVTLKMATLTITKQSTDVTVPKGKTATAYVNVAGEGLTFKWYYKNVGDSKFYLTNSFKSNIYSVAMDASRNGRQVYCVISDKYGNTVKTNPVTLKMANSLTITKQPVNVTVAKGKTASVYVNVAGEGLTFKWYYKNAGDSKFSLTDSFKSNTYSVAMDASRNGRQVYCVISDKYGNSVKTNTVTLKMASVTITKQPTSVTVAKGQTASVYVNVAGEGLTFKWYYKNVGDVQFYRTTSFTGNTYSITMDASRNGRQVYCVISDKYGNSVGTDIVFLKMK